MKVGDRVKAGQTVCILEAMKLMNEIESDFEGTIEEVLVETERGRIRTASFCHQIKNDTKTA